MSGNELLYKSPNHVDNLNSMRLNNKWCDVTIAVDGMKIRAHKVILAANLKYFDVMLSNDAFQESKRNVITMESMKGADLEAFVSYAYTGEILLTDSNALNLLITADYLSEDAIKDVCIEFLKKHLKADEACRAYKFAAGINCISLENVAKRKILSSFETCSQAAEYLDFNYEDLSDILPDGKAQPATFQQSYFEGIMKWIMHDVRARKIRMEDLFNCVDITKLTADDLIGYVYENMTGSNDEYTSIRDHVMSYYHTSKSQQMKSQVVNLEKSLVFLVSIPENKLVFQFYNFTNKKWSPSGECTGPHCETILIVRGAILNNKVYYIFEDSKQGYLNVFDPATKRSTKLLSTNNHARFSAVCACDRFIYLCGGLQSNNESISSQVLRYDPLTHSLKILTPMITKRMDAAAICYQGFLLVLGGSADGSSHANNSVERYDPNKKEWTVFPSMSEIRSGHAVAVLDGKLYACGGFKTKSVEVYDPSKNKWQPVASMNEVRCFFLLVVYEGKIWAIGGNRKGDVEVYDPLKDEWQINSELSSDLKMTLPTGGLIQSSCIANMD